MRTWSSSTLREKHAEAIGDEVTLRRTDLALFDLDVARRTITCNLVEVKCYAQSLGLSGYEPVEGEHHRAAQSKRADPATTFRPAPYYAGQAGSPPEDPRARDASGVLSRAQRSLRADGRRRPPRRHVHFIDLMEEGYALHFTRSGLVFDFDKPGTEPPEREVGVEFHRIGSDLIRALVGRQRHTNSAVSTDGR